MSSDRDAETHENDVDSAELAAQVYALAREVPAGRVMSYGALGARCEPPISGYICGRIMRTPNEANVPWWRIVAKTGALPIIKRNPQLADEQRALLESEGIGFKGDSIEMAKFAID